MKKFAWMIAILGLCAGSMVACGGDDEKKANGEACEAATDCISNYCNEDKICADAPANDTDKKANGEACEAATDCKSNYCSEDKICADDPALEIPECEDNGDCENHTEGKLVCNVDAGVCVECLADNKEDDACDGSKPGPICVENVCSKCTDNAQCGENQECDLDSGKCVAADGTCLEDKDCKDPATPHCVNSTCVAEKPAVLNDPCKDVECDEGECQWGVCVTEAMKNATSAADIPATGFCDGNTLYYIDKDSVKKIDCTDGWGTCVGYAAFSSVEAGFDCSGTDSMLERCATEATSKIEISACVGNKVSNVYCIEDLKGNPMALPKYSHGDEYDNCEEKNQICAYDAENNPICKAAE